MFMSSTSLALIAIVLLVLSRAIYKAGYRQGKRDEQLRLFATHHFAPMHFEAPE